MTSRFSRLHVGLAGCGKWGRFILRDLKALGCRVTVVARSESSRDNARQEGADSIASSLEELPDGMQGAVVAVPTTLHAEAIERLLPRGIPVFTEKAMTTCSADARRILERAGDRVFVMDKWRYHPGIEALAAIARDGELGPVESVRTTRYGWGIEHTDVDPVWILTPHDLAIVLEIVGHIADPQSAVSEWAGGEPVGLTGVLNGYPRVTLAVSARYPKSQRTTCLDCRDGSAMLEDSYAPEILIRRSRQGRAHKDDSEERRPISTEMPLLRELRAFLEHLDGGPPPRSSAAEGTRIVEVVEGLRALAGIDG